MVLELQASGISGNLYNLVGYYLTNRKYYVEIEGQRSNKEVIAYGVPQKLILSPKLFSGYVNNLPEVPRGVN